MKIRMQQTDRLVPQFLGTRQRIGSQSLLIILSVAIILTFSGLANSEMIRRDVHHPPVNLASGKTKHTKTSLSETSQNKAGASSGQAAARLLSLRIEPQEETLWGARSSQRFVVLGVYSDGLERDVSSESQFSISDARIAKVNGTRKVTALADGDVRLKAEMDGQVAKADIHVRGSQEKKSLTFSLDISRIFTKRGCNDSPCHGGVKGRGGFKLSFNAVSPREDYKWIVEGGGYQVLSAEPMAPKKPRISVKEPEQSLLLLKPTFSIPHGGGLRFESNSIDYQTILNWVRMGAPYGEDAEKEGARVESVKVFPEETVLGLQGKQQLLVTAYRSNARREDITDEVFYESLNPEVVKVTSDGLVQAVGTGEAAVIIRAPGEFLSARFGVIAKPIPNYPEVSRRNLIDDHVFAKLRKFNILPSELSTDAEFLRRVCLDVTGTLPPPNRVREFVSSQDNDKRDKLIDILLDSPEYVDYWTFRFADLFRVGGSYGWVHLYWEWVRKSIAQNIPYDQMVRENIAAQGYDGPTRAYMKNGNKPPLVERLVAEQFRVFMGRRLDCAQCHNHPYDRWTQNQFWGLAAFFGRMTNTQWYFDNVVYDDPNGHEVDFGEMGKTSLTFRKVIHPRAKQEVVPTFPDGKVLPEASRADPRMELAKWMTSQPGFAEATVNRMWEHFWGRGIVDPVDDFRVANAPTHPQLLAALARDFAEHGYDLKHLIRTIVQSRAYQLSSRPNESNRGDKTNFSHAMSRPLEAEVLLDAISTVTEKPEVFQHVSGGARTDMAPLGTRAIGLKSPADYPSRFLEVYGRPTRLTVEARNNKANLSQALHMLVGSTYTQKLSAEGGRIDRLLRGEASDREVIEELYLAALSRFPTEQEGAELEKMIRERSSRREALTDLLCALISSWEFADKH